MDTSAGACTVAGSGVCQILLVWLDGNSLYPHSSFKDAMAGGVGECL